jgi:hypothetical protein
VTLCVYAVTTRAAARIRARGAGGEPLRLVPVGGVAAVVGEWHRAPRPSAVTLRRYDRSVRALAARPAPLLPARFGTCFATFDDLTFSLRSREKALSRALRHVRGRVQMTVRIIPGSGLPGSGLQAPGSGMPTALERSGAPKSAAQGVRYLRERAAHAAREREIPGFGPVQAAVTRWVRDEKVEKSGEVGKSGEVEKWRSGEVRERRKVRIASVYHLVPRASADAYRRAAERAAESAGLAILVSGPHPAYAFS